jgi:2-phosphoglycerate kinase
MGEAEAGRSLPVAIPSSKYDYVKVKVWLHDHYYVLSRFLVSRMLALIAVPADDAARITLELKKTLVDGGVHDIPQASLQETLFQLLRKHGYGGRYTARYQLMSTLYQRRLPILILICGTGCIGKSFVATRLAERINVPNLLQTGLVVEFLASSGFLPVDGDFDASVGGQSTASGGLPLAYRPYASPDAFLAAWRRQCALVRKAVQTDLNKCMQDGKALIIEGFHIDPALYVDDIVRIRASGSDAGIVVPWLFTMDNADHTRFVENWLSTTSSLDQRPPPGSVVGGGLRDRVVSNYRAVDTYLRTYSPPFDTVALDAQALTATIDKLHNILIEKIQVALLRGPLRI